MQYHFDIGDSSKGPLGLCARVTADSKEAALANLAAALPLSLDVEPLYGEGRGIPTESDAVQYIAIYLNPDAITVENIDSQEDD